MLLGDPWVSSWSTTMATFKADTQRSKYYNCGSLSVAIRRPYPNRPGRRDGNRNCWLGVKEERQYTR